MELPLRRMDAAGSPSRSELSTGTPPRGRPSGHVWILRQVAQNARDGARIAAFYRERAARNRAWRYWQFDYGGRLDFEDRWARERDRWLR
jgi:hypothetical protein